MGLCGLIAGGIAAVFFDFNGGDPGASFGMLAHHCVKDVEEMPGDSLAGTVGQEVAFEECTVFIEEGFAFGVVLVKKAGVVEVGLDPVLEVFEIAEVDDKAVGIGLAAGKVEGDGPVVPVNEGAMPFVPVLAVGKGDVAVGFFAGEHGAIRTDWKDASG